MNSDSRQVRRETPSILSGDIKVSFKGIDMMSTTDRITLSSGVQLARQARGSGNWPYAKKAWIPSESFQRPDEITCDSIVARTLPQKSENKVCIIGFDLACLQELRNCWLTKRELDNEKFPSAVNKAATSLISSLSKTVFFCGAPKLTGIAQQPFGLTTVTFNKDMRCRIGLHVDSWYPAPINLRHYSPSRLCINIGESSRWFLFVNRSLFQMADDLGLNSTYESLGVNDLIDDFFTRFPSYPVIRIQVQPGEAYIAATEQIIHDASTISMDTPDLTYTYHGYFKT